MRVVDIGSLNGTYLNGEPIDLAVLANGDEIQIGKFRLVLLIQPPRLNLDSRTHHHGAVARQVEVLGAVRGQIRGRDEEALTPRSHGL